MRARSAGSRDRMTSERVHRRAPTVEERWGAPRARCFTALIGRGAVPSLMLGFRDEPSCAECLAVARLANTILARDRIASRCGLRG